MNKKRTIVLGRRLEGSALTPLYIVSGRGTRTRYKVHCADCNSQSTRLRVELENPKLAKACASCVRTKVIEKAKNSFNNPGPPELWSKKARENYGTNRKPPP